MQVMDNNIKEQILLAIYDFFVSSHDFNGMPLRDVSKKFEIDYVESIELVKKLVRNHSYKEDIVLDCFCGSGTTCVACKETGRRYIGMEIDKEYHKIAVDRLNGITANGQTSIFTDFENI